MAATIGALLTISIPDLKSNSQDTSAFYLKNIYQLQALGNPNVSSPSIPSSLAEPALFSPPKYAIWVNSLWFLSLAISLSCATEAITVRNWAVQYISISRSPYSTSEKKARTREIFAKGPLGPNVIWGTGIGPLFLHLALFLFIAGGLIYLFNINRSVFYAVVWWVGYMAISYARTTVAVFFDAHNLLHTPLSPMALRIYLVFSYVVLQVCAICSCIPPIHGLCDKIKRHYRDLSDRYSKGFLNGKQKLAREIASKPSPEVDARILERILPTLDEDSALETFFDSIPGFCRSKITKMPLSFSTRKKLRQVLDGFLDRTFSSSLISESDRSDRFITCLNAADAALGRDEVSGILAKIFDGHWDEALQSVEIGLALTLWDRRRDHGLNVKRIVACIVARVRERDDRWTKLVEEAFDIPDYCLRDSLTHGDSVLLFILIHISRENSRASSWTSGILSSLSKFDICNTLPILQDDFCALWNELSQEAINRESFSVPAQILSEIRHCYFALFPDTYSNLIASIGSRTVPSLTQPNQSPAASPSYSSPIESDHAPDGSTTSQQVEEAEVPRLATIFEHIALDTTMASPSIPESIGTVITCDPDLLVPGEASHDPCQSALSAAENAVTKFVGSDGRMPQTHTSDTSQAPVAPFLISQHSNPVRTTITITPSIGPDPGGEPDALQGTTPSATLSHPLQDNKQQDIVVPCAAPDISEILPTAGPIPRPITTASPIVVSDSRGSPTLLLAHSSDMTTAELPSSVESPSIHIPNAHQSLSLSLSTANCHDIHDLNPPISVTVALHSDQTAPPAHNIVAATLQPEPEDQAQHDLDKL